jgi:hypothetical protein
MDKNKKLKGKKAKAFESLMQTLKGIDVAQLKGAKEEKKSEYAMDVKDQPTPSGVKEAAKKAPEDSEDEDELEIEYSKKFRK